MSNAVEANEEIEVNAAGGMGSKVPRFDLIDARALRGIAEVCRKGAEKYAEDNWRACSVREHVRHAIAHLYKALEVDQQGYVIEDGGGTMQHEELSHAACRAVMALAVFLQDEGVASRVVTGVATTSLPQQTEPVYPNFRPTVIYGKAGDELVLRNEWTSYAAGADLPAPAWTRFDWNAGLAGPHK